MSIQRQFMLRAWTLCLIVATFAVAAFAAEAPRMTKEELLRLLGSQDIIVIDTRTGTDWNASEFKIKGAIREEAAKVSEWVGKYPKDKTLVFYCA